MEFENVYFLGIGGIGMSALARYFRHEGKRVGGYDRTESQLTDLLTEEGIAIHYTDDISSIPQEFLDPKLTVVVYTPAVSDNHSELCYFRRNGFEVVKRSQMLGYLSCGKYVMAVAGTHGKTTTSTLLAWLNDCTLDEGSAFLGGISKNFDSNLVLGTGVRLAVEADEFDRSFLQLFPDVAIITSADADHLDIYGTHEVMKEAFSQFVRQIKKGGALIIKQDVDIVIDNTDIAIYRYAYDTPCDFYAHDIILVEGGMYRYNISTPDGVVTNCTLGIPGRINIENSVAAVAAMWCAAKSLGAPFSHDALRNALKRFCGVKRRFDFHLNTPQQVYIDDYAHHPRELEAAITSVKNMFPLRRVTAIFQPHLYTRTQDFYKEFALALSHADHVVLLPIYPAREEPIEGVSSQMIARLLTVPYTITPREDLAKTVGEMDTDVVVSFGAGNIDACCEDLTKELSKKA